MEENIQLTILTTILLQQAERINTVTLQKATETRQRIKPLSKEDKHKEETKPKKELPEQPKPKKDFCQCDTDYRHTYTRKTLEAYVLNCCGYWPFSNSVEEGSRLEFANQATFEKAIKDLTLAYYCTECKM